MNTLSELAYRLRQSRVAKSVFVVGLVICVALITLARTDDWEDTAVVSFNGGSSVVLSLNRYVSVTGTLVPERAFQTQADVGGLRLSGGRYIPLMVEGASDPLLVLDKNVPSPDPDGQVRLVGKIQEGGSQAPYYLEIGAPPNLPLQNLLARIGIVAALALLAGAFITWLISRADYAIAVRGPVINLAPAGVGALWFGSLGAEYGNAIVRHAPVNVTKTSAELKLESTTSRPPWTVRIREIQRVVPTNVATAYGTLPGARVEFQDERGLLRRGTLAVGDVRTHEQLRSLLQDGPIK